MPSVDWGDEGFEAAHLSDGDSGAKVTVIPERGGMVTAFDVGDTPVLYLDRATLVDKSKNVRGGIPVLFPTPGKLRDDRWRHGDDSGTLKQHGFARERAWRAAGELHGAFAAVALRLEGPGEAAWPWAFAFDMTYSLRGRTLRLDQRVSSQQTAAMPFGVGFHPYFYVADADKAAARVETAATRAFDNVSKQTISLARGADGWATLPLTAAEVDLHLLDHTSDTCVLALPGRRIVVRASSQFTHWVVWTLRGRDFVCVEPWTCPGDALNTGERLLTTHMGAASSLWMEISLEE